MSTPNNTSTDFDMLMQRLTERNLSDDKIAEIVATAENTLSPEQAQKLAEKAKEKMGNKEFSENGEKPAKNVPEADLVAEGGFAGDKKNEEDKTESKKGGNKSKGKDDKLENKKRNAEKGKSGRDEMKNGENSHAGNEEKDGVENSSGDQSEEKKPAVIQILEYRKKVREIRDVYKDDPLKAFEELARQKPSGQAPSYIQQKYDSDRSDLLRDVDDRIRTSPEGTKYSPEKLGEELYKYQSNAETKAFAEDVLKNNQNNQELQESYKEAANKTPESEEQKKQEKEQQKGQNSEPKRKHFLRKFFGGRSE